MQDAGPQLEGPSVSPEKFASSSLESRLPSAISPREMDSPCVPAIALTNEKYDSSFYEKLRGIFKEPGIIYGAGVGNIFAMLECFAPDAPPRGLVTVDINPAVVMAAKIFVKGFKHYDNWKDFAINVLFARDEERKKLVDEVISSEKDPAITRAINDASVKRLNEAWDDILDFYTFAVSGRPTYDITESPSDFSYETLDDKYVPILAIARNYALLHKLATEGNIAAVYSDMFNPDLLKIISELPEAQGQNLIYTSNISQTSIPTSSRGIPKGSDEGVYEKLNEQFGNLGTLGSKNVFVHAEPTREKQLLAQTTVPQFKKADFIW